MPRAKGGSDDPINLTTSCFDCNRGKSDRRLGDVVPRPDADLAYLQVQQEVAEAKRYLDASRIREELENTVRDRLENVWCDTLDTEYIPNKPQWKAWFRNFSPEEIEYAIKASARFSSTARRSTMQLVKYVSGVLWNAKKQSQSPPEPPAPSQLTKWPHNRGVRSVQ